jgi:hypothetical protein
MHQGSLAGQYSCTEKCIFGGALPAIYLALPEPPTGCAYQQATAGRGGRSICCHIRGNPVCTEDPVLYCRRSGRVLTRLFEATLLRDNARGGKRDYRNVFAWCQCSSFMPRSWALTLTLTYIYLDAPLDLDRQRCCDFGGHARPHIDGYLEVQDRFRIHLVPLARVTVHVVLDIHLLVDGCDGQFAHRRREPGRRFRRGCPQLRLQGRPHPAEDIGVLREKAAQVQAATGCLPRAACWCAWGVSHPWVCC